MNEKLSSIEPSPENPELVRVILGHDYWLIGYIINDAVRVLDIVENGQSAAEMSGEWPRLKPVTFEYLRNNGYSWEIEPYNDSLPVLTEPHRWPSLQEILKWKI